MKDGFKIVDIDAHLMEPEWLWETYIEDEIQVAGAENGHRAGIGPPHLPGRGRAVHAREGQVSDGRAGVLQGRAPRRWSVSSAPARPASAPQSRLQDMDEQGVDVQIIYPTVAGQMLGREFRDTKLLAACCRAYNDWAIDYCSKRIRSACVRRDPADAGRRRGRQGGAPRGAKWAR